MKKIVKLLAVILVVAIACSFAGCGKKEVSALDKIKEKGKLTVLTNASFPPFEYIDANGDPVGVDIDSCQKIADAIGVELEVIDMDFDLLIEALNNGKGDLIAAGMTATEARAEVVDFSIIYISMGLKVIVPVGTDIQTFDDLDGKKIALQEATTAHIYAQDNYKNAEILPFKSAIDAANAVKSGNADCAILDMLPAEYMVSTSDEIVLMDDLLSKENTAMAVAKGSEDLLAVVNETLQQLMDDGSLDASFDSHMLNFQLDE